MANKPICYSCHIQNLKHSAILFRYMLLPINKVDKNLSVEYHVSMFLNFDLIYTSFSGAV